MIKIGIITDKYHLEKKISELLKYLKSKAEISIYIKENYLLKSFDHDFNEDIFFVKGKNELILALVKLIKNETSIPVINSYRGIWNAINRFMSIMLLQKAGISVPTFSLNPKNIPPPFEDYIIKNIIDQKTYAFSPRIDRKNGHLQVSDERAIKEKEIYKYFYYQKFIKSKWEYKIYGIGNDFYFYKQLPLLVNPNKMESRKKIDDITELKEIAIKTMKTLDLKIVSLDFLKSIDNNYYLTDINCSPNFNYIKDGSKIVGDFLLKQAKKG
ncbi:MAG: ATP-grasp domain-containing protein [Promethearchaeota archaeon]